VNYATPVVPPREMTDAERNFEAVWQASLHVLGRYGFQIDRQDRRTGIITALPLTGKHYFELWRRDAVTAFDLAENTLQTIYRTATVTVRSKPDRPDQYEATVGILVARSDQEAFQVTNTSEAYDLFISAMGHGRIDFLMQYGEEEETEQGRAQTPEEKAAERIDELAAGKAVPPAVPEGIVLLGRDEKLEARVAAAIAAAAGERMAAGRQD